MSLRNLFQSDAKSQIALKKLQTEVLAGRLSPFAAAEMLLENFKK